jgi:transposase
VSAAENTVPAPAKLLLALKGVGPDFASVLWQEGLYRHFDNRRQVAAYAGLAPTPWQSGSVDREQGVSKSGNPRLRTTMLQLAWLWLRHQPDSALSRWFHQRVGILVPRLFLTRTVCEFDRARQRAASCRYCRRHRSHDAVSKNFLEFDPPM